MYKNKKRKIQNMQKLTNILKHYSPVKTEEVRDV
jgi:hypothetical protein